MLVSEFDYHLPPARIAQEPLAQRESAKMLVVERSTGAIQRERFSLAGAIRDGVFADLPAWLRPGDLLVVNNTRVIRARLFGRRAGLRAHPVSPRNPSFHEHLRGRVEVLLTKQLDRDAWEALVRPGRKIGVGETLIFDEALEAEVLARGEFGARTLRFRFAGDFFSLLDRLGHVPLPPYIHRPDRPGPAGLHPIAPKAGAAGTPGLETGVPSDDEAYQTVYARQAGSVAAPTAGLHFSASVLERLRQSGVEIAEITLHVGLGTFQPVRVERVEEHRLHSERYEISPAAAAAISRALAERRRVVAVGTTTVRVLEHQFLQGPQAGLHPTAPKAGAAGTPGLETGAPKMLAGCGETSLFIYPGFSFQVVGALLTNFHLPCSTLLMLVCAFGGRELVLRAYEHAVREGNYRFYSYGDCMLVV